ncbi:MAG: hypothetical protein A2X12_02380 [Bacteroidetes bacterium GWE2_29_8]|nr:MAG: hypothetical protein A2X12_02380 [Bacteroidetes bacterium GWE2_29_8]OFY14613.1 MAG: hypothetical protein A2X02_05965 [Bacteroidetes bacterium GWF2_29_10]
MHALRLDVSTISYILIFPVFIMVLLIFNLNKLYQNISNTYYYLITFIYSLIAIADAAIYSEWKTKLNVKALVYVQNPSEVFNSIETWRFLFLLFILFLIWILLVYIYKKINILKLTFNCKSIISKFKLGVFYFTSLIIITIGIRGGVGQIPISESAATFSDKNVINNATINPAWSLLKNYFVNKNYLTVNPFKTMSDQAAKEITDELNHVAKDTTIHILKTKKPDIIFILLESWSADCIYSLGADTIITPNFDKLTKEGILFNNFYANGNRSQQGIASLLTGFPALPITNICEHPAKYNGLPSLNKYLKKNGYSSSFIFGGDLDYGNIKSFIIHNGFDNIIQEDNFSKSIPRGKLGVHDEYMYNKAIEVINTSKSPSFNVIFTLSSHSPYDQPLQNVINYGDNEKKYVNSIYYADKSLSEFINNLKKRDLYDNKLIILMADHSHSTFKNHSFYSFEYHKIPLLIIGGAIKEEYKGIVVDRIASQIDVPVTILKQLRIKHDGFYWSKDLFNKYSPQFAFFEINSGLGWKNNKMEFVLDIQNNQFYLNNAIDSSVTKKTITQGKAYIQQLFSKFMEL